MLRPLRRLAVLPALLLVAAAWSGTALAAAPTNTVEPAVGGRPQVGATLRVSTGTWTGSPSFTYQWQQCDVHGGACADLAGETASAYVVAKATTKAKAIAKTKAKATR